MSETNKALVRRFYAEVMSQGQVEVLDEIMAADFRDHGETLFGLSLIHISSKAAFSPMGKAKATQVFG